MMQPPAATRPQQMFKMEPGIYATSTAATPAQPLTDMDSELSDILNTVIDIAPDYNNILGGLIQEQSSSHSLAAPMPTLKQLDEDKAISAITQSLMQFENTSLFSQTPYSMHNIVAPSANNQQVRNKMAISWL